MMSCRLVGFLREMYFGSSGFGLASSKTGTTHESLGARRPSSLGKAEILGPVARAPGVWVVMVFRRVCSSQGLFYVDGARMSQARAYPEEKMKNTEQRTWRKRAA